MGSASRLGDADTIEEHHTEEQGHTEMPVTTTGITSSSTSPGTSAVWPNSEPSQSK